ncbi:thioredoxin domain-containing protein [Candidatus Saccharibacteria bacterium]|nr:thioredoxin domain-containing protein [Candidatus Saccharibacteria bacterium]
MSNKIVIAVIAVIVLVLGILVFLNLNRETSPVTEPASSNTFGTGEELVLVEAYSLGCPACADYHPILKEIRQEYADKITFQAVHFPLTVNFGNARAGHRAVEAAARQGKFWEMHDILFERRDLWTAQHTDQPIPQIETFAEELGLDLEQFRQDFQSAAINDVINRDERYLKEVKGVSSTPTFFINGRRIASTRLNSVDAARQTLNEFLGIETETEETAEPAGDGQPDGAEDTGTEN